jgi:GAF domain-containing protein
LVARAVRSRQGVIVNDVLADPGFLPNPLLPKTRSEMAVPLVTGNQVMGVLDVQSDMVNHFTTQDINIQTTLASQVAAALQNARLFNQTEERAAELVTINAINQVASSQLDLNTLLYAVGERLQETFAAHAVNIALYTEATNMISFPYFYARDEGHVEVPARLANEQGGFSAQIIQTRKPLLLELTSPEDAKLRGANLSGSGRMTDSYLGVPMVLGEQVLGVIGLSSYREVRMYDETDINLLITLASTIGVAIQNAQQFEVTRRRAERERIVNEITQKIQSSLSMESALQTAVKELGTALGAHYTQVDLQLSDKVPALPENGDGDLRQKTG